MIRFGVRPQSLVKKGLAETARVIDRAKGQDSVRLGATIFCSASATFTLTSSRL